VSILVLYRQNGGVLRLVGPVNDCDVSHGMPPGCGNSGPVRIRSDTTLAAVSPFFFNYTDGVKRAVLRSRSWVANLVFGA
jgi:hypothetical protein